MAKVFIERMKAEESFMRMAVVVVIVVVGDGLVVLAGLTLGWFDCCCKIFQIWQSLVDGYVFILERNVVFVYLAYVKIRLSAGADTHAYIRANSSRPYRGLQRSATAFAIKNKADVCKPGGSSKCGTLRINQR